MIKGPFKTQVELLDTKTIEPRYRLDVIDSEGDATSYYFKTWTFALQFKAIKQRQLSTDCRGVCEIISNRLVS